MDNSQIVFSKPIKYKSISTSQTKEVERKDKKKECTGTTCKTSPYCFCWLLISLYDWFYKPKVLLHFYFL